MEFSKGFEEMTPLYTTAELTITMFLKTLIQWHPLVKDSKVVYCHSKKQDLAVHANSLGNGSLLVYSMQNSVN